MRVKVFITGDDNDDGNRLALLRKARSGGLSHDRRAPIHPHPILTAKHPPDKPRPRLRDGPGWVGFCAARNPARRAWVGSAVQPSLTLKPVGLGRATHLGYPWRGYYRFVTVIVTICLQNHLFRPQNSLFGGEISCLGGSCEPDGLLGGLGFMLWPSPAVLGCACSAAQPAQVAQPARPQSVSTRPISKPTLSLFVTKLLTRSLTC